MSFRDALHEMCCTRPEHTHRARGLKPSATVSRHSVTGLAADRPAGIDGEDIAGDVAGLVAQEKERGFGHFLSLD